MKRGDIIKFETSFNEPYKIKMGIVLKYCNDKNYTLLYVLSDMKKIIIDNSTNYWQKTLLTYKDLSHLNWKKL